MPALPLRTRDVVVAAAGIVATLPYVVLKVIWVAGGTIGLADARQFDNLQYLVGNAATLVLDALAVVLILALVLPQGRRLPDVLILLPP